MTKELDGETPQSAQNLHTTDDLGETQEEPSLESPHSTHNQAPKNPKHQASHNTSGRLSGLQPTKRESDSNLMMMWMLSWKLLNMTTMITSIALKSLAQRKSMLQTSTSKTIGQRRSHD